MSSTTSINQNYCIKDIVARVVQNERESLKSLESMYYLNDYTSLYSVEVKD